LSSVFDFFDFSVDEAVVGVVVVFDLALEASFKSSVVPGIDDNAVPVVGDKEADDKGTPDSLGKLSVYSTLAGLLFSIPFSFQLSCASISVPPNNMMSS